MMTQPTDSAVNERLARFCGWEFNLGQVGLIDMWAKPLPGGLWRTRDRAPDCLRDGNAMVELLEALAKLEGTDKPGAMLDKLDIHITRGVRDDWLVMLDWSWGVRYEARDDTLPRAVAMAAYRALEAEDGR